MKRGYRKIFLILLSFLFVLCLFAPTNTYGQPTPTRTYDLTEGVIGIGKYWWEAGGPLIGQISILKTASSILGLDILNWTIENVTQGILYIIGIIAGFFVWLGAQLIGLILALSSDIASFPIVTIGWGIVRDIANLGFVLAIILIALATIVRYEEYGAKKLLPKLIAAAILVNFSLTIGTVFIDFSNVLTDFFISKSSDKGVFDFASILANSFAVQKLMQLDKDKSLLSQDAEKSLTAAVSIFVAAIFSFLIAISMLGMALMLLVRMIYLAVLLVISPITWLFWVIPQLAGEFKKWWGKFLNWVFYAPILAFFLYLTLRSMEEIGRLSENYKKRSSEIGLKGLDSNLVLQPDPLILIANIIILTGFVVAGLLVAQSLGMTGASSMMKLAQKAGSGVKGWAAKKGKERGVDTWRRTLAGGVDKEGKTRLERFSEGKIGGAIAKIPLIGRGVTAISAASSKAKDSMKKRSDELESKYKPQTKENLLLQLKQRGVPLSEYSAMANAAIEKGGWEEIEKDPELKSRVINSAKKTNNKDKVLGVAPSLATEFEKPKTDDKGAQIETDEEFKTRVIEKAMAKVADATKLSVRELEKISSYLRPAHLTQLANNGTSEQKKTVANSLEKTMERDSNMPGVPNLNELNRLKRELMEKEEALAKARERRAPSNELKVLVEERDTVKDEFKAKRNALTTTEAKRSYAQYERMQEQVNWHDVVPPIRVRGAGGGAPATP